MLVAINRTEKNKVEDREKFKRFNGTFENVDLSLVELAAEVGQGHAFCAQHEKNWRSKQNFTGSGFLAVDVDEGLRLEEALAHEFIQRFGGMIYTSPSHTEEAHRFRIVFELEEPIHDRQMMEHALTGLIRKLGGDASCKDACRLFFGNTNALATHLGHRLPAAEVAQLVLRGQEIEVAATARVSDGISRTVHSRQPLDLDTLVRDSKGIEHRLVDLPPKTQVHCPVHVDRRPSAFTLRSATDVPGIHCMTCRATFFISSDGPVYDFDYRLRVFRDRSTEWHEVSYDAHPSLGEEELALPAGVRFLNEPFISPVDTLADVILVKSPKGTGKTEWLKQIVDDAKKNRQPVLLIGHRQALIMSTARRLGLTPYITIRDDPQSERSNVRPNPITDYYAICLDSLETRLTPQKDQFPIVIIDEVEQVLSHLTSDTIRPRRRNSLMFLRHYLQKAEKVYVLDADLNRVTGTAIPVLIGTDTGKECLLLVNDWKPARGTTHLYGSSDHLLQVLREHLAVGDRCFVCSNSKKFVNSVRLALQEQYPDKSFYSITSENSQTAEAQDFLLLLPNSALNYDCVLVSPAVGTGVDITFPNSKARIDAVFGFFGPQINTHFDIDQQLCRVRHPGSVHVWVSPATYSFETEPEVIRRELVDAQQKDQILIGLSSNGAPQYLPMDELYAEVYSEIASLQRASKNELRRNFIELRRLSGWEIAEVALDKASREQGHEIAERGEELSEEQYVQTICEAVELTIQTYKELKTRSEHGTLLAAEVAAIRRFEIESFYYAEVTPDLVSVDDEGRYQAAVRRYELIHTNADDIGKLYRNNPDLLLVDRRESIDRRRLLIDLFTAAGIFRENEGFDRSAVITQQGLEPFIKTCRQHEVTIQRLLGIALRSDLAEKAAAQLGQFVKRVGITLGKAGTKNVDGKKVYLYELSPASLDAIQEIVNRRQDKSWMGDWKAKRGEDADEINQRFRTTIEAVVAEWKARPKSAKRKVMTVSEVDPQTALEDSLFGDQPE